MKMIFGVVYVVGEFLCGESVTFIHRFRTGCRCRNIIIKLLKQIKNRVIINVSITYLTYIFKDCLALNIQVHKGRIYSILTCIPKYIPGTLTVSYCLPDIKVKIF